MISPIEKLLHAPVDLDFLLKDAEQYGEYRGVAFGVSQKSTHKNPEEVKDESFQHYLAEVLPAYGEANLSPHKIKIRDAVYKGFDSQIKN